MPSTLLGHPQAKKIAICIATYRRPKGLARLLHAVSTQVFRSDVMPDVSILVVDNDPERSAAELCRSAMTWLPWPLTYLAEPNRGISHARNMAVETARQLAEFIAFVDDDEVPASNWLEQLLLTQQAQDADVVTGPVLSVFETPVPRWLADEPVFARPRFRTGMQVDVARTGNVLIRLSSLGDTFRFDTRFGLSGGEDTLLFLQLARAGYRIVWADEAIVSESVPASRASVGWALKRAFRTGNAWSLCENEMRRSPMVRLLRFAKGTVRMIQGLCLLPTAAVIGPRGAIRALRYICLGAGNATGALALRYQPYSRPDGC